MSSLAVRTILDLSGQLSARAVDVVAARHALSVRHDDPYRGGFTTRFIDDTAELYRLPFRQDRATRLSRAWTARERAMRRA